MSKEIVEIWKDIPGYEGYYQVSDLGRVKSLERFVLRKDKNLSVKEKILKFYISTTGYFSIKLYKNNKKKGFKVHQLVAMAFLGYTANGVQNTVCDHIDNNPLNNKLPNLQIITRRENNSKDRKSGTSNHTGVSWHYINRVWEARIQIKGKRAYLGTYKDESKAAEMYQKALENIHLYDGCNKKFRLFLNNYTLK